MTTPPISTNAVDLQGLDQLRRRAANDDPAALAEAAVQFEALFIGMMLDSARSASLGDGLFDGPQTEQYLTMMDRQVALELARGGGFGFAKMLMEQLGGVAAESPRSMPTAFVPPTHTAWPRAAIAAPTPKPAMHPTRADLETPTLGARSSLPATPDDFVAKLLPQATDAAAKLGVEPRLLLAQAALETGWGGAVPKRADGVSAHNLFGIKAGASWRGDRVAHWTIEHGDGVAERRREEFRAYADTSSSFADYVDLITGSPRYAAALESAHDAEGYARAVSAAGYATDPAYADKWLAIYHGDRLEGALRKADAASASAQAHEPLF